MQFNKNLAIGIVLTFLIILAILGPIMVGKVTKQTIKLGYCPTMFEEAQKISIEEGCVLTKYNSASQVLSALRNNQIQKGLIGRKTYSNEINSDIKEQVIESDFTLVSNKKGFIDYSQLNSIEIYSYSPLEEVSSLFSEEQQIHFMKKQEALKMISQGKIVLIEWKDWQDNFELVVVMNGSRKIREFRGVFLYSM